MFCDARLRLELVGYRASNEIGDRLHTPLWVISNLSGDHLPHVLLDLDRDAVVLVGVTLGLRGQGFTPLGALSTDNGIARVLGELDA